MEAILSALEEEKEQTSRLMKRYKKELGGLPQGTFFVRRVGKNYYGYLTSSEKGKIQQQYLGRLDENGNPGTQYLFARWYLDFREFQNRVQGDSVADLKSVNP